MIEELKNMVCPVCKRPLKIIAISSFDDAGAKLGGIFKCPICEWTDLDNLVPPEEIKKLREKKEKNGGEKK